MLHSFWNNVCADVKPRFYKKQEGHLIKSILPFVRLNIDYKGPIPSKTGNNYILTIVDGFSRFPFAIPYMDLSSAAVIKSVLPILYIWYLCQPTSIQTEEQLFSLRRLHLACVPEALPLAVQRPYYPAGNGQVEQYNGRIWKTIQLAIKTRGLELEQWETVINDALNSIRSLPCTATNCTLHIQFIDHPRRSRNGGTLPSLLNCPGKDFIKETCTSFKV